MSPEIIAELAPTGTLRAGINLSNFLLVTVTNYFSVGCGTCAPGHFNVNSGQLADDVDLMESRYEKRGCSIPVGTIQGILWGFPS